MESPSCSPESQEPVLDLLASRLADLGYGCRRIRGRDSAGQLLAVPKDYRRGSPKQLLLGHCDTVWPVGTLTKMPVTVAGGRVRGPGVYDMKAGLVQALFAVQAMKALELSVPVAPLFFINTDEEIGSPESAVQVERLARIVNRVFVMEPSLGEEGRLKTSRKGVGRFVIRVVGKAAHAGLDPEKGISAVLEMSHLVQQLFSLNDVDGGTSVNVGTIRGGTRANVIAAESEAEIDVRVRTGSDASRIERAIHGLRPTVPGIELQIEGHISRPPMEPTPRNRLLWQQALESASQLGIEIEEGAAGGGSDGNWTSLHTATLDGLGAVGEGAHALSEQAIVEKMPERAALLASLLVREPTQHTPT